MSRAKEVDAIAHKVREIVVQSTDDERWDQQDGHHKADALLVEALKAAADGTTRPAIDRLLGFYEAIPKWYA